MRTETQTIRDTAEMVKSARVTKNLQQFIDDRFHFSSNFQKKHTEISLSKLPNLNSSNARQSSNSRSKFRVNRTITDPHPHTRDFSIGASNSGTENKKPLSNLSTSKFIKLASDLLNKSPDSHLSAKTEQINKNSILIQKAINNERSKAKQSLDSKSFTNVSFYRQCQSINRHADSSQRCLVTDQSEGDVEEGSAPGRGEKVGGEQKEGKMPSVIDFDFKTLIDRMAEKNHPENFEEVN